MGKLKGVRDQTKMNEDIQMDDAIFIHAVRRHPEIWNATYNFTEKMKLRLWKDIVMEVVPDFLDLDEDEHGNLVVQFRRKWVGLRNSFIAETKRRLSHAYRRGHAQKSLCPNYHMLSFIYPCLNSTEYRYCHAELQIPLPLQYRHNIHITFNQRIKFSEVLSAYLDSKLIAHRGFGMKPTRNNFLSNDHTFHFFLKGTIIEPEEPEEQKIIMTKMLQRYLNESEKIKNEKEEKEKYFKEEK